tara:strand:+ start:365 stop:778 length:414 start_codon:yes stop_codon:yes gene_type:complete
MGAAKAGVTIVTFDEKDSEDALHQTLKDSGARGLLFSPDTEAGEKITRGSIVQKLMPTLENSYKGDPISQSAYPLLKSITQTGFNNIRGIHSFKDSLVYANSKFNCFTLPTNSASTQLYECFRGGNRVSELTNGDIA